MATELSNKLNPARNTPNKKILRKRSWSGWMRWLHVYLSMFSFGVLLFFAVTGITLNHTEWFSNSQHSSRKTGQLNPAWVKGADTTSISRLEIVEFLRQTENLHGYVSDFLPDEYQVTLSFKGPGYMADVFINRENGQYEINLTESGWVGIANDLHKGRDSGKAWSRFIDISALLMIVVSLTGLLLIFFLKKKLPSGMILLGLGIILAILVYLAWVP